MSVSEEPTYDLVREQANSVPLHCLVRWPVFMSLAPEKTAFLHVYIQQLPFIEGASLFVCIWCVCIHTCKYKHFILFEKDSLCCGLMHTPGLLALWASGEVPVPSSSFAAEATGLQSYITVPGFPRVLGTRTQVLMLAQKVFCPLSYLPWSCSVSLLHDQKPSTDKSDPLHE